MSEKNKSEEVVDAVDEENQVDTDDTVVKDISVEDLLEKLNDATEENKTLKSRAEEMTNLATRLQADFDNYRKRTNESNKRVHKDGMAEVIEKFIPILDVVDQALSMITDDSVKKGVVMIQDNFQNILKGLGVQEIDAEGKPFDPKVHEAIMQVEPEKDEQSGICKQVFQKGYTLDDRIIRASKVIVTK